MKKKIKRTNLLKRVNIFSILLSALFGAFFGVLFTVIFQPLINKFPKIFQEFYNLFYYSIPLNIVIILILIILFFVIVFRYTKKRITLIALLFLIFSFATIACIGIYQMRNIKDKSFIIIAKFEDSSKQASIDIDGRLYDQLSNDKTSISHLNSFVIERIPIVIKNKEEANKEIKNSIWRKAKIIILIWGRNDDIGGTAYFDVIKAPKKSLIVPICVGKGTSIMEDIEGNNFSYYKEILPATINSLSYFIFGLNHYYENNYTEALVYFKESLKKFPIDVRMNEYFSNIYLFMGSCYYFLNDLIQAEDQYREAIRINTNHSVARNNLGNLLFHPKCHDFAEYCKEAQEEYREAIRIDPNNAVAHNNLGSLWHALKYYDGAQEEYREAIRIDPNLAEAHNNLGNLWLSIGRKDEAKKEILKARELFEKQGRIDDIKRCDEILRDL